MKSRLTISVAALLALPLAAAAQDPAPPSGPASSRASTSEIEIGDLIARYARRTGQKFIVDPRVRAQVPLAGFDPNRVDYDALLAIFTVHQVAAVKQGEWIIVVPDANARQLPTPVFTERNFKTAAPDEIVTLVTNVRNACAAQAVPVLRPLMPQSAHMAAYVETNTLILSDHAVNVHRLVTVIEALERAANENPAVATECPGRPGSKTPAQ